MREVRLGALLVVLDRSDVPAVGDADDDRHRQGALVPVRDLRELRRDLVEGREHEAVELDLDDGSEADHRQADGGADDARLGEGRVEHATLAELGLQTLGHPEDAAQAADVLTHQQHPVALGERAAQPGVERTAERHGLDGRLGHAVHRGRRGHRTVHRGRRSTHRGRRSTHHGH